MLDHEINRRPLSTLVVAIVLIASIGIALPVVAITAAEQAVATFSGQVLDPQNGLLPGTTITLVNTQTQVKYEVKTNRDGRFEIPGVVPGPYVLESKLPGFQTLKWEVTINGQNVDRELRLELGTLQETITLRAGNGWPPSSPSQPTDPARIEAVKKKYAEQEANCASRPATAGPQIGGNIRTPVKLRDVRPVYPAALVADGVAGKAVLNTTIGPDGLVREVSVVSATRPEFADALSDAVRQWQFSSTLLNCTAMEVKMVVTGNFEYR
jgi:TonB family protein